MSNLSRRSLTDRNDITTWSLSRILLWMAASEAKFRAHRIRVTFRPGPAGECVCKACMTARSTYGK